MEKAIYIRDEIVKSLKKSSELKKSTFMNIQGEYYAGVEIYIKSDKLKFDRYKILVLTKEEEIVGN